LPKEDLNKISVGTLDLIKRVLKLLAAKNFKRKTGLIVLCALHRKHDIHLEECMGERGTRLLPQRNLNR